MSEMVERVAKAAVEYLKRIQPAGTAQLIDDEPAVMQFYRGVARAAIEAMREPTDEMWAACEREKADHDAGIAWPVMIDEALR
jgi:hypothetical protein